MTIALGWLDGRAIVRSVERAVAAGALATALVGVAGTAAADNAVERLDDGTVLLRLGEAYGWEVIETSVDELGSVLSAGDAPFDGVTVTILTHDEGLVGPISGPIAALAPIWEELTGGRIEIVLVPITELFATMMLDLEQGTGAFDAIVVPAHTYGDLMAGNFMRPIDPYLGDPTWPAWSPDSMPDAVRRLYTWEGVHYGVLNDADGQVLYYRRDILTDPDWQAAFEQELGYPLPVPPQTWQQVLDIARFFDGRDWDDGDRRPDSGMVLPLRQGEQSHFHFQALSEAFTRADDTEFWFNSADMTPRIAEPGNVAALEMLVALADTGPGEMIGWRLGDAWRYFLRGKAVITFSWGDLGSLCQDRNTSRVAGKCGVAVLPGSDRVWDTASQAWIENPEPIVAGNTVGSSWHGVVSTLSDTPDAAYSFLALMAIEPVSVWNAAHGWTGVDPGFFYQFLPPDGTGSMVTYLRTGWNRQDLEDYLSAYHDNFTAPHILPYLRIRGTEAYWRALDHAVAIAVGHRQAPDQALAGAAADWQGITDRLGRDAQRAAYLAGVGGDIVQPTD